MTPEKPSFVKKALISVLFCTTLAGIIVFWTQQRDVSAKTDDTYKSLETFSNVLSMVQKNYVEEVDSDQAIEGAIKGMLTNLDPHSSYLKPDDFKELKVETKGSFTGIGVEITQKDGILTVVSPIEGTPGYKKGLKAGDRIVKIGDESTGEMSLMEAVKRLRGAKGTKVSITVHRKGWTVLKKITLVRDEIPLQSVKARMLEPGYGYIRVSNFQSKTTKDFLEAYQGLAAKDKLQGLIVDLRNNPGGLLDQAVKLADVFLDDGIIVSTKGRIPDQNMLFKAHADDGKYDLPTIVLVNEGSASASEIVAGALQDHKKAIVLGAQTFGKGSVQTIIPLSNGAGLRLTTARYYTPNGISIQAKGITPDINVPTQVAVATREPVQRERKPRFIKEKDLKHHIPNGDAPETEDKDSEDATGSDDEASADEETVDNLSDEVTEATEKTGKPQDEKALKDDIQKDNQLNSALMLLKGVNVFGGVLATEKK